jgi:hypothetical protein
MNVEIWQQPAIISWTQLILDNYENLVGKELIDRSGTQLEQSKRLFFASFIVFSHGTQTDPLYNYANQVGLDLWEMTWEKLTKTPSRTTTEPMLREERQRLLAETSRKGYVTNYEGIRISATGKRYKIRDLTIWNLKDNQNNYCGQAAAFSQWYLKSHA